MVKPSLLLALILSANCCLASDTLTVYTKRFNDGSSDVMVTNEHPIPYTLVLEYMPVNMVTDAPLTDTVCVPARSTKRVCSITPVNRMERWTFSYRYRSWRGDYLKASQ